MARQEASGRMSSIADSNGVPVRIGPRESNGWPLICLAHRQPFMRRRDVQPTRTGHEMKHLTRLATFSALLVGGAAVAAAQGGNARMNSASLRFIPVHRLEEEGYGQYAKLFE